MPKDEPRPELPIPPGNGNGDPHPHPVRITSISPIGGVLAGGIDVTLTGIGFQPDAEVFFGTVASPEVHFISSHQVTAKAPPATQVGTVTVSLVNPDDTSANAPGGFTYVTSEGSLHAEVFSVTPLSVIEDTESEITIRGRNLISAYNDGIVALRGPSRVQITSSNFSNSHDDETGIELLTLTVRVTATPPLEQQERIAIQVLAAVSPQAANNGVFDSSRQMFTVLPRAIPVLLAYTANLTPGQPNLVMVAGKNLKGCSLSVGKGAFIHLQQGDNETLAGIVSVPDDSPPDLIQLTVLDSSGSAASQLDLSTAPAAETESAAKPAAGSSGEIVPSEPPSGKEPAPVNLTPVPGQSMVGPTKTDSATFSLGNQLLSPSFLLFDFEFVIYELDLIIPLFNEVRLIPFFDNGVGDVADTIFNSTPILAQVGKLLRLRGVGLLIALRVDLLIHIEVVLVISFNIDIWPWGFYNEFPDYYPWAFGSIVISIYVIVQIFLLISFLVALVEPLGHLRVLFYFNLVLGIDFELSTDGHVLSFHLAFKHKVTYTKVSPFHNFLPCGGNFQLAEENGQTVFIDNFGGSNSFYFPRAAGQCCLPWDFDLQLIRFEEGGPEETIQGNFRTEFCLNAAPPTNVVNIIITSEHPAPIGVGPQRHLEMTFNDLAHLIVLAEPADANGNPTGQPAVDITTLGYDVEFYLDPLYPDLFNPVLLPSGDAEPVQAGNNFIHARIHSQNDPELFNFRPDDIFGFVIQRYVSQGQLPGLSAGILPVTVQDPTKIIVTPTLAYRDAQNRLVESPSLFVNQGEAVREIERFEPFEYDNSVPQPQPLQRDYSLAARISFPTGAPFPQKLTFTIDNFEMKVLIGQNAVAEVKPPLENTNFIDGTGDTDVTDFFAKRVANRQRVEVEIASRPGANELIELKDTNTQTPREFKIAPHIRQESSTHLVPPGKLVANRQVMLFVNLKATSDRGTDVETIKQLKMAVRNDETYEEYLRVFPDTRALVTGSYASFVKTFFNTLPAEGPPSEDQLNTKGAELWNIAVTEVQTSKDDRPLYWARLQSICALRAYYHRNRFGTPPVTQFEWPSRGLDPDGSISFGTIAATSSKAIVTGFDPFQLAGQPKQSNPSGLIAITLSGKPVAGVAPEVIAATAVFPVRYRDFDAGLIEKAVDQRISVVRLIVSCSLNNSDYYDVERWASKARSTFKDNENLTPTASVVATAEFTESTLPYETVITAAIKLTGPNGDAPFVSDQSYKVLGVLVNNVSPTRGRGGRTNTVVPGKFRPEPLEAENESFLKQFDKPGSTEISDEGSGGNYLSNEIFYRIAKQRDASTRKTLASGHFHLPLVSPTASWNRDNLIAGVKDALKRFLNKLLPLRTAAGGAEIPVTPINRTSQKTIVVGNDSTATVTLATVATQAPFAAQIVGNVPAPVTPGASVSVVISFTPTSLDDVRANLLLKDGSGGLLGDIMLVGEGSAAPPAPVITGISPTQGRIGDSVLISGTDLDGATIVKVGSVAFSISSSQPTQIEAEVMGPPRIGPITVTTPSGTATSSQTFRVVAGPHHPPEDLAAQLTARRVELGLSPQQAATQMGTRSGTYRRWERGFDRPSARFHAAIVTFLGHDPERDPKQFGEEIRAARERDGLSRSQLGRQLGLSSATVKAWEAGTVSRPSPRVAGIFENYLQEE